MSLYLTNAFFIKLFFQVTLRGTKSKCQKVWIQLTNVLLVLIWVQTVIKCHHLMKEVVGSKEIVNQMHINEPRHVISNNVVCATS